MPFVIAGVRNDKENKVRIKKEEINSLIDALKKHTRCGYEKASALSIEDIANLLKTVFGLAEELFPPEANSNKE